MAVLGSPFTAEAAANLPDMKLGGHAKVTIRVSDANDGDKIYISTNGRPASATNAQFFLNDGEAIDIHGSVVTSLSDISVFAASGTPAIFWGLS